MKSVTKFLLGVVIIFFVMIAFFGGRNLTSKIQVEKASSDDPASWMNPYTSSSPMHREFDQYRQWILNNEKLATFSGMARPTDRLTLSGQLATKGFARLPTDLLEQHLPLVGKMLTSLDTRTCSNFIKYGISDSDFSAYAYPIMNSFNDTEAKAWFLVNRSAIEAQLNGSPFIESSMENIKQAIFKISKLMSESQSRAFISRLGNLKNENDEDACSTARTLYIEGNLLPEPYRGYMARLLLAGDDGRQKPLIK